MVEPIVDKLESHHLFYAVETLLVCGTAIVIVAIYSGFAKIIADKFLKDKKNE